MRKGKMADTTAKSMPSKGKLVSGLGPERFEMFP